MEQMETQTVGRGAFKEMEMQAQSLAKPFSAALLVFS
jgi:hypothetical protein